MKEFHKTAERLNAAPYNLHRTNAYIKRLLEEIPSEVKAPDIGWVRHPVRDDIVVVDNINAVEGMSLDFDVQIPTEVRVENKRPAKIRNKNRRSSSVRWPRSPA